MNRRGRHAIWTSLYPTAWHLLGRHRGEASADVAVVFDGPVEVNGREAKRIAAQVVHSTDKDTLQIFVTEQVADDYVEVYTDDSTPYWGMGTRIPGHAEHLGGAEVHRGAGGGFRG